MGNFKTFLKGLFFTPKCVVCGGEPDDRSDGLLCFVCRNRYENEEKTLCDLCHRPYSQCACRVQFSSPYIQNYCRVTLYRDNRVSGKLVLCAKDRSNSALTEFLAERLVSAVKKRGLCPEVICYVPCSAHSYRKKGFDHGKDLAQAVGKQMALPVVTAFVRKSGKEQKNLNAKERLENSKATLKARPRAAEGIAGKRVLLVDDIMTTGASALVASVHLEQMGAKSIDFVCFGSR